MKTNAKIPRHWHFKTTYVSCAEARIYNAHPLDEGVDEIIFVNKIVMFGLYGIFLRATGWAWRPKQRIIRLSMEVEWT
jgi:hypothetical protein